MKELSRLFSLCLVLSGCQAPWVQYPQIFPRDPAAERASFPLHDPLPDQSLGPNVSGRPPMATEQRSEPRRTLEAAIPMGGSVYNQPGVGNVPPAMPFTPQPANPGSQFYPQSISP